VSSASSGRARVACRRDNPVWVRRCGYAGGSNAGMRKAAVSNAGVGDAGVGDAGVSKTQASNTEAWRLIGQRRKG